MSLVNRSMGLWNFYPETSEISGISDINIYHNISFGMEPINYTLHRQLNITSMDTQRIFWPTQGAATQLCCLMYVTENYTGFLINILPTHTEITQCHYRLPVQRLSTIRPKTNININNNNMKITSIKIPAKTVA